MRLVQALLPVPLIAACDASQTLEGGDALFDPSPPRAITCDSGCVTPAPSSATWTALYHDYFGPTGIAQCGRTDQTVSCHHDDKSTGAQTSGFICGDTQESCYEGITSPSATFAGEQVVVACQPCNSFLLQVLRHDGGGVMPYKPETVVFSDTDMARIQAWVASGAPNN